MNVKFVIVFAALFAVAFAGPQNGREAVITDKDSSDVEAEGYSYGFDDSDSRQAKEPGRLKNAGSLDDVNVQGSFQYVGADGATYTVKYIAEKNGFQRQGAHIPVA